MTTGDPGPVLLPRPAGVAEPAGAEGGVVSDAELLDSFPLGELDFASMPEEVLRPLFESCRVEIRFNKLINDAVCKVSLDDETLRVVNSGPPGRPPRVGRDSCTDVFGAPGRIRTCAPRSGGACSIP